MKRIDIVLLIALLSLGIVFFLMYKADQVQDYEVTESQHEAKYWKDKYNRARVTQKAAEATEETLRKVLDSLQASIETEDVVQVTELSQESSRTIKTKLEPDTARVATPDTVRTDSLEKIKPNTFHFKDEWTEIKGEVLRDSILFNQVRQRDSISIISYYKREGLFKRSLYVEVISHNPHVEITGVRNYKVRSEPRRLPFAVVGAVGLIIAAIL